MSDTPDYQIKIVAETNEELSKDIPATEDHLNHTINFMIKQMQGLVEGHSAQHHALMRELVDCHKEIDRVRKVLHRSKFARLKLSVKKVLLGLGWYEASSQELQLIHEMDFGAVK